MKKLEHYYKCPYCGSDVDELKKEHPQEYTHECHHCDEDFYLFEVLIIK